MRKDCIAYARGSQACQKHGSLQRVPEGVLHSVVKPWPFRGWAMDLIGQIFPFLEVVFLPLSSYGLLHQVDRSSAIENGGVKPYD